MDCLCDFKVYSAYFSTPQWIEYAYQQVQDRQLPTQLINHYKFATLQKYVWPIFQVKI